jgi:excisionase family DNA binding protein
MLNKILTPKEIAKRFGITEQTVSSWRSQGMPYKKLGKFILILEDEFTKWVKELKTIDGRK